MLIACQKQVQTSDYTLFVTLENAPFDSLFLFEYTSGRNVWIAGEKTADFTWEFTIPDSIVWDSNRMRLRVAKYDLATNSVRSVRFITDKNMIVGNVGVEDKKNYIHAVYMEQTVFPNEIMTVTVNGKDTVVMGDIIEEDFKLILQDDNSDITVRSHDPWFSWFDWSWRNGDLSYNEYLERYDAISKKFPDSRFLISSLSSMLDRYKSREDVKRIYDNLSDKHKHTIWAENIERFLQLNFDYSPLFRLCKPEVFYNGLTRLQNTFWEENMERFIQGKFENSSLLTLDRNSFEKIVEDGSKYNLILFTASWCGPCRQQVPILEQIYADLKDDLIMTYVSVDEERTVSQFQKQMAEKQIPWRALLAYQDIEGIKKKYFFIGIPTGLLVYPDGTMSFINLWEEEQREKLYSLCGK
jgi:thiol-disulfide isomerase/thioredoxin